MNTIKNLAFLMFGLLFFVSSCNNDDDGIGPGELQVTATNVMTRSTFNAVTNKYDYAVNFEITGSQTEAFTVYSVSSLESVDFFSTLFNRTDYTPGTWITVGSGTGNKNGDDFGIVAGNENAGTTIYEGIWTP